MFAHCKPAAVQKRPCDSHVAVQEVLREAARKMDGLWNGGVEGGRVKCVDAARMSTRSSLPVCM